ncbi:MAG TPA: hypothetical protein PKE57_07890 [Cellvibrionaceae bacterium]|nr:hypothetical protein [Cellvibrionaceae bacterium]
MSRLNLPRSPSLRLLHASLWALALMGAAGARAEATAPRPQAAQEAPLDSEFWELYDELADDRGRLPAPEEIPPPKESLLPTPKPDNKGAKEEL